MAFVALIARGEETVFEKAYGLADRKGDFETMSRAQALERILGAPLRHEPGSTATEIRGAPRPWRSATALRNYPEHDTTMVLLSNTFKAKKPHIRNDVDEIEDAFFVQGLD